MKSSRCITFKRGLPRLVLVGVLSVMVAIAFGERSVVSAQEANIESPEQNNSAGSKGFKGMLGGKKDSEAPLYVKSDSLKFDAKRRIFTYQGNVEVVRDDIRMTCDVMVGTYDKNSRLQTVLCRDNVVITRSDEMRASSNRAKYSVPQAIIVLTEDPELARAGNMLSADKITIFVDEDRSEAEGNVRVKVLKEEGGGGGSSADFLSRGKDIENTETKELASENSES